MDELQVLLNQEIPAGKAALLESKNNLKNVAAYCSENYIQSQNKKDALEETKKFTTQSLASVAYQINTLASNMLQMMDIQATQLANMESAINNISQTVDIHKEKVARREIGQLTTNKVVNRSYQIVAPANPDRTLKYVRKPIDFNELDDIGHGVKLSSQNQPGSGGPGRRPSNLSGKATPTPTMNGSTRRDSMQSIGSSGTGGYGTLRAVRAPTVPTANFTSDSRNGPTPPSSSYDSIPPPPMGGSIPPPPPMGGPIPPPPPMGGPAPPPPPMGGAVPPSPPSMTSDRGMSLPPSSNYSIPPPPAMVSSMPPPPPSIAPPPPSVSSESSETYSATSLGIGMPDMMPPPPEMLPPPPGSNSYNMQSEHPSWAPANFLEKVIVIYDYSAENPDELTLAEDETVYITKKNDDGWYEGVSKGGKTGLFPGNYVEPISS